MGEMFFVFTIIGMVAAAMAVVAVAGDWMRCLAAYVRRRVTRLARRFQRRPSIWVREPDARIVDTTPHWYREYLAEIDVDPKNIKRLGGPMGNLLSRED